MNYLRGSHFENVEEIQKVTNPRKMTSGSALTA
jgi:hypothetical protein